MKSMISLKGLIVGLLVITAWVGNASKVQADRADKLIEQLRAKDSKVRKKAAQDLIRSAYKKAVEPLIAALQDEDRSVRANAARALGNTKDPRALEPLINALKDESLGIQGAAVWALGKMKDPRAAEPLIEFLGHESKGMRGTVAEALGRIGNKRAVGPLIDVLKEKEPYVQARAAFALGKIKDPRAVEPLLTLLGEKDWSVRSNAVWALGEMQDSRAAEPLIALLKDEDPRVRRSAAKALGKVKDPRSIEPLAACLTDEHKLVRFWVGEALEEIKGPCVLERLFAELKDNDLATRRKAAQILAMTEDPRAVEPLIAVLKDENTDVQQDSVNSLNKITGKNLGIDPAKWRKWWEKNKDSKKILLLKARRLVEQIRCEPWYEGSPWPQAGSMLVKMGKVAIPVLIGAIKDDDDHVSGVSSRVLQRIGHPAIKPLIRAIRKEDSSYRPRYARTLCQLYARRGMTSDLLKALKSRYKEVRAEALTALTWTKPKPTIAPKFIKLLEDPEPEVRGAAALALRRTGDNIAGAPLIELLKDSDAGVRAAAAGALGLRRDKGAIQAIMTLRNDPSPDVRWGAVVALELLCDLRSIRCLVAFLDDTEKCKHGSPSTEAAGKIGNLLGRDYRNFPQYVTKAKEWWKTTGERRYGNLEIPEYPAKFGFRSCARGTMGAKFVNPYVKTIERILPEGWEVLWSDGCQAPNGWQRIGRGKLGAHIHLWQPDSLVKGPEGSYIPSLNLYFMPLDWEGNSDVRGETIKQQGLVKLGEELEGKEIQESAARYCGATDKNLLFCSYVELGEWRNAPKDIAEVFKSMK